MISTMQLYSLILYLSVVVFVCSAYRLNHHLEQRKFDPDWDDMEDYPERDYYREFGILESPRITIPLPRPYVGPNKSKYKTTKGPITGRPNKENSGDLSDSDEEYQM